ncbi:MAG: uncharacterized protein KVP18_003450 [Porospora cf. gigantea A]|uniref:uncharacterized protein n=1 Tax=Porospora cf. gigantea A TaxID=2853593 RepID=UPI00355AA311|nr:MAG: hypothetical protein KVP18_003450 [Porospora cf. gigantea A]
MAGIWGLIGYGLGNALPSWTLILVGPKVIQVLGPRGFSVTDFVLIRFGRSSQVFTALLTVFYNVIFISAELTGISDCLSILIPGYPVYAAPLMISLVTLGYSLLGGIRASYATDYIQAPLVFLVTVGAVVAFMVAVAPVEQSCFETALKLSSATGVVGGVTLLLSVTVNEFLNQGLWQRFVSARSFRDAAIGLSAAGLLSALTVILFGFVGVVALADALQPGSPPDAVDVVKSFPSGAFFMVIGKLGPMAAYSTLVLAVLLSMSTVDTQQNAIMGLFVGEFSSAGWSLNWLRLLMVLVNVPAVALAAAGRSVLELFLVSNILSSALVPPIFLGLSPNLATPASFIAGSVSGLVSIVICGVCMTGSLSQGFTWFALPFGAYDWRTLVTFVVVLLSSSTATVLAAQVHFRLNPDAKAENQRRLANYHRPTTSTEDESSQETTSMSSMC